MTLIIHLCIESIVPGLILQACHQNKDQRIGRVELSNKSAGFYHHTNSNSEIILVTLSLQIWDDLFSTENIIVPSSCSVAAKQGSPVKSIETSLEELQSVLPRAELFIMNFITPTLINSIWTWADIQYNTSKTITFSDQEPWWHVSTRLGWSFVSCLPRGCAYCWWTRNS